MSTDPLDHVSELAWAFAAPRTLSVAARVGLLRALGRGPQPLPALCEALGLEPFAAAKVLRALAGLRVVDDTPEGWSLRPGLAALFQPGPGDLSAYLAHLDAVDAEWGAPLESWLRGAAAPRRARPPEALRTYAEGLRAVSTHLARAALPWVPGPVSRVLDVGGGLGAWSLAAAERWPGLYAEVLERPALLALGTPPGLHYRGGDYHDLPWGTGWDLVLLVSVLHQENAAAAQALITRAAEALRPGGWLLLTEHRVDADGEPDPYGLLFSLHMRSFGEVWPCRTIERWLAEAAFEAPVRRPLPGRRWAWVARRPG